MDFKEITIKWMRLTCAVFGVAYIGIAILLVYIGNVVNSGVFRYNTFIRTEDFANCPRAAILLGVFLLGILWLQISGTVQEWAFIMFLNAALLGYLVVVGAFLLQFVANDDQRLSSQLQYGLLTTLKRYKEDSEFGKESRMAWTQLQISNKCCGANNYTDWVGVWPPPVHHEPIVPTACCKKTVAYCSDNVTFSNPITDAQYIHVRGCFPEVLDDIPLSHLWQVLVPFLVVGGLSVFMSAYLSWEWRSRGRQAREIHEPRGQQSGEDLNPSSNQSLLEGFIA